MTSSPRLLIRAAGLAGAAALAAAAPAAGQPGFGTGPVSVSAPASTPQVELRSATVAMGPTYDRVVFTFAGPPPRVRARYVGRLVEDGSGRVVRIPGRAFLELVFEPARAHDDRTGRPGCAPRAQSPTMPMLRHVRLVGDFEGQVTYGLGLSARTPYRVMRAPSRRAVIVDVRR